jgi:hypothetical protein
MERRPARASRQEAPARQGRLYGRRPALRPLGIARGREASPREGGERTTATPGRKGQGRIRSSANNLQTISTAARYPDVRAETP